MPAPNVRKPASILAAVSEFDRLGHDSYLKKYGYRRARRYFLKLNGQLYDSKAIVGVAHGHEHPSDGPLTPAQFVSGEFTVLPILEALGFVVLIVPGAPDGTQVFSDPV